MGTVNHKLISEILRRKDQEQRDRAEQERRRAEAAQLAAIEERCLRHVLGSAIEQGCNAWSRYGLPDKKYVRPHPSDAGRKRLRSPAGQVADKGRKWGGCLPGSFETGKR